MANISQIKLPNGDTHNFIDTASGYTKNTGTITGVKTTAGAHTTIDVTSGAVTFNVPTKTSHLTNDSGFITTDTNTTYSLSNALSSHKFTSTLTAGGSGSGTSTVTIQFAAGSNITLTDDTTNKKITIAATDTKYSAGTGLSLSGTTFNISTVPIANGGTGKTTAADAINVLLNGLPVWTAVPTDSTYFIRQDTGGSASYGKATFSTLWTYINGKVALNYLPLTGGSVTGPTTFGDTVSIDDLNAGQLVVSGSASIANNLQANTINGVAVGNSPKFTDTVTTATTTGSGNAVTAITASNGALTVTKGTTFLTSHNTYTISTTGSGNAVTAVSLSGTTFTVTKGATYSNNAGTITSVKTTAGAHTAINTTSGAVTFNVPTTAAHVGALASDGTAVAASTLAHKTLNDTTINNTAGTFAFSGSGEPWSGTDWVGFQVGDSADKFQFTRTGTAPMFRYNDSGGTNSSNWSDWSTLYSTSNKPTAADIGIKFGYTTSGNNRAVLQDSSGNLYVTQKDTDTTVSTLTLAEDTGTSSITLAHSGKYKLTAGTKTVIFTMPADSNTDTKVKITAVTPASETTNYVLTHTATSGTTEVDAHAYNRFWYKQGSTSVNGYVYAGLGNNVATGTANNSQGYVRLYGPNTGYGNITYANTTANTTHTLPSTGGTILNTGTTSFTQSLTSGTQVGTIEINGSETKLYAPTNTDHRKSFYGTCSTAAGTAAKVISLSSTTGWELVAGTTITVKFSATNTADNPTFNVNSSGAKSVWYNTAAITTSSLNRAGYATRPQMYVYDGTYWVWMGMSAEDNTTYSSMTVAEITAGSGTTARLITPARLKTAIETWENGINCNVICATGTANTTTSLTSGTITQVPLTTATVNVDHRSLFDLASNRISISGIGVYRITGSVYVSTSGVATGVYIRMGTGTFANATEIAASLVGGATSVNVTKTIEINDQNVYNVYLGARCQGAAGTVANNNAATYLEVEFLGLL